MSISIAVLPGDGIGKEIVAETCLTSLSLIASNVGSVVQEPKSVVLLDQFKSV